jgi:hypothetical protein
LTRLNLGTEPFSHRYHHAIDSRYFLRTTRTILEHVNPNQKIMVDRAYDMSNTLLGSH